jgi:transcriptional regulator with XRE-family HTH domain
MLSLLEIGSKVATARKAKHLRQADLASRARVSRATLDALENGRMAELGFAKLTRILAVLGLDLALREENLKRPTLDELRAEDRNA